MKAEIEERLKLYLRDEGIDLHVAANDDFPPGLPAVVLERVEDMPLYGSRLLSEIRVMLGILGKPWQCEALVKGLYHALHPHNITHSELTVILMSLHIETVAGVRPNKYGKRAVMRYIVEEPLQK